MGGTGGVEGGDDTRGEGETGSAAEVGDAGVGDTGVGDAGGVAGGVAGVGDMRSTGDAVMSPYIFGIFISRSDLIPATTDVIR